MSLDHAILGFLHYRPLSGYELKAVFDATVRHFWPADQGQIYRTLSRLEAQQWTTVEVIPQEGRPDRKLYTITPAGSEELRRWLLEPLPAKPARIAALVQIFFAGQLADEEILGIFHHLAELHRAALAELQKLPTLEKEYGQDAAAHRRDQFFWRLTLEYGLRMVQANLDWFEDVIARLERGEHRMGGQA